MILGEKRWFWEKKGDFGKEKVISVTKKGDFGRKRWFWEKRVTLEKVILEKGDFNWFSIVTLVTIDTFSHQYIFKAFRATPLTKVIRKVRSLSHLDVKTFNLRFCKFSITFKYEERVWALMQLLNETLVCYLLLRHLVLTWVCLWQSRTCQKFNFLVSLKFQAEIPFLQQHLSQKQYI